MPARHLHPHLHPHALPTTRLERKSLSTLGLPPAKALGIRSEAPEFGTARDQMSPPLVDHTAIDYHAPPSDPSRAPTTHAPAHACILRPVGSDDEQLLFPEGWKHSLRTRTMLILSPRSPCTHSPHTTHTQPSAPMPRGRPARAHAPAVKSDLYSWESILRGKLEMGSALPWVHFLTILCTSSWAIPPSSQSLPIFLPSPLLIHLVHLNRSDRLLRSRHFPLLGS